ncbi:MAG: asparagine synthase (glutamine-hydrolyzing) [Chromatiaceae bacterium]|nr:asparagine synthase (glutamine-hydrolyzing) [Chromatiaceae bacterium]
MCGIAGFVCDGPGPDVARLWKMARILHHRGPDDAGIHVDENIGLVHTRLAIIDLEGGHQPMHDDGNTLALVANGEIYNHVELARDLKAKGRTFETRSDSETILHAYAVYGRGFLQHLNGMFALALHDKSKRQVILARDRLGIKPLYFAQLPNCVVFASEIKAILPFLDHAPALDADAFIQYLEFQFSTGRRTLVHGIQRLLPGEAMAIDSNLHIERWRYWSPLDARPRNRRFEEAAEEFDGIIERVMTEHLRADVPFGLFLSGGVDSGVLAAMIHKYQDRPIRTFSVGYRGTRFVGELEDASRIANLFATEHTVLELEDRQILRRIPHMVWANDELMRDYACLPTSILAEQASREVKMVFTGEGGDEVFAGYGRYRKSPLERLLNRTLAPGSGGFRTHGQWHRRYARDALGPGLARARQSVRMPFVSAWKETPSDWSDVQRSQYTDMTTALPDNLLVKADRMLMGFALEGRVPFLDHRIVEFGLSLPDDLKVQPHQGKWFLKRWAERHLPSDHLYRKKRGFNVPVGEWLRGPFLEQLAGKLIANRAIGEWFNVDGVKRLIDDQRRGRHATREIMGLTQFAIWHRLFIERLGEKPSPDEDPLAWIA